MVYQIVTFYAITFVFVLTSNLMLIYGFYKTSRPFKIITKLFIYLSICDTALMMIVVLNFIGSMSNYPLHKILSLVSIYSVCLMGLLIFWTISVFRFISIFKPMYQINTRKVNIFLLVEVLICLFTAIVIFFVYNSMTAARLESINLYVSIGIQLAMIFMNLSLNISSLIVLRRSTNLKARQKGDNVLGNPMVVKRKKMALNTLLLITIVQLVCNLPLTFYLWFFTVEMSNNVFSVFGFVQCLQLSNTGINSLIVIWRKKDLHDFYRLKCCSSKGNKNVQNRGRIELVDV